MGVELIKDAGAVRESEVQSSTSSSPARGDELKALWIGSWQISIIFELLCCSLRLSVEFKASLSASDCLCEPLLLQLLLGGFTFVELESKRQP